jgi:hypothetical protein
LQVEVLELRKLAVRLKKHPEELAIRSAELEKLVQWDIAIPEGVF